MKEVAAEIFTMAVDGAETDGTLLARCVNSEGELVLLQSVKVSLKIVSDRNWNRQRKT
jgi:hypothetical protein